MGLIPFCRTDQRPESRTAACVLHNAATGFQFSPFLLRLYHGQGHTVFHGTQIGPFEFDIDFTLSQPNRLFSSSAGYCQYNAYATPQYFLSITRFQVLLSLDFLNHLFQGLVASLRLIKVHLPMRFELTSPASNKIFKCWVAVG